MVHRSYEVSDKKFASLHKQNRSSASAVAELGNPGDTLHRVEQKSICRRNERHRPYKSQKKEGPDKPEHTVRSLQTRGRTSNIFCPPADAAGAFKHEGPY